MSKDSDREKLIGYIERMHEVDCALRVIDTVCPFAACHFSCLATLTIDASPS